MKKPNVFAALLILVVLGVGYGVLRRAFEPGTPTSDVPVEESPKSVATSPAALLRSGPSRAPGLPVTTGASAPPSAPPDRESSPDERRLDVTVLRPTGEPAEGADVTLTNTASAPALAAGTTDGAGRVTLPFPAGSTGLFLRAASRGEIAIRSVPEANVGAIELQLESSIVVRVRVRDLEGVAVPASVQIDDALIGVVTFRVTSPETGIFESTPFPRSVLSRAVRLDVRAARFAPSSIAVTAPVAEAPPIDVRLAPVVRTRGRLLSAGGRPVKGTAQVVGAGESAFHEVSLIRRDGGSRSESSGVRAALVETEADGRFDVEGLRFDGGDLVLFADGHAPRRMRGLSGDHGDVELGEIALDMGADVRGVVVDGESRPVPGAWVTIKGGEVNTLIAATETDEQGTFHLAHVGALDHTVTALWDEGSEDWQKRTGQATEILAGASNVRIVLVGGLTVRLFVAGTRTPLVTRSVTISASEVGRRDHSTSSSQSTSGEIDRVRLEVGPGRFDVTVKVPGYDDVEFRDVPVTTVRETMLDAPLRATLK